MLKQELKSKEQISTIEELALYSTASGAVVVIMEGEAALVDFAAKLRCSVVAILAQQWHCCSLRSLVDCQSAWNWGLHDFRGQSVQRVRQGALKRFL